MQAIKRLTGWGDRAFFKLMIALAVPIMLQQALSSVLYLLDNVMVGRLGDVPIAAVGVGNQLTFLLQIFSFGISSGAGIFAAQYWGKRDLANIRRIEGLTLVLSVVVGVAFTCVGLFAGEFFSGIYSHDDAVIALSADYLKIAAWGYLFQTLSLCLGTILFSCESPVLPMLSTLAGVVTNGVLNYVLIFGKLGLPALGVEGAAIATVIASVVNLVVLLVVSYVKKNPIAAKPKEMRFDAAMVKGFFKVALPVFFNEALWSVGVSLQSVLYGQLGTPVQTAMQILSTVDRIGFILMAGLGKACGVMVGNAIGEGKPEQAKLYSQRMRVIAPLAVFCLGLVLFALTPVFLMLYDVSAEVHAMALSVIRVYCLASWLSTLNFTIVIGTLRAGGDTLRASLIDLGGLWLISLPISWICGKALGLPITLVYPLMFIGDALKAVAGTLYTRRNKWIKELK